MRALLLTIGIVAAGVHASAQGPSEAVKNLFSKTVERSSLTTPGSPPFHLKLRVSDDKKERPEFAAEIEIWWASPDKWRREIKSTVFSQTALQHGPHYAESSSGDYLPWWLHNVITETLDPLPLAELQSVNLSQLPADRCLKWDDTFAQGSDQIGITNLVCFNSDDTLKTVISRTAAAKFDNYRNFGPKKVARAMESWAHTPDNKNVDLRTTVAYIESLQEIPELFAVSTDTPPNARLRFVNVPESALRDYVQPEPVYRPQPVNPHVGRGTVLIDVTTDKHGHVRTASIKESAGKTLDDAALQAALQWEFTPSLMKGIAGPGWATIKFKF
jgi:TonB family protein